MASVLGSFTPTGWGSASIGRTSDAIDAHAIMIARSEVGF
jgi:hypothetical protein